MGASSRFQVFISLAPSAVICHATLCHLAWQLVHISDILNTLIACNYVWFSHFLFPFTFRWFKMKVKEKQQTFKWCSKKLVDLVEFKDQNFNKKFYVQWAWPYNIMFPLCCLLLLNLNIYLILNKSLILSIFPRIIKFRFIKF